MVHQTVVFAIFLILSILPLHFFIKDMNTKEWFLRFHDLITLFFCVSGIIVASSVFWWGNVVRYDFIYFCLVIWALLLGLVLTKYVGKGFYENLMIYFFAGLFGFLLIFKGFALGYFAYRLLPLSPVDIAALLIIARPLLIKFVKRQIIRQILENYIALVGLLGGIIYFFVGQGFGTKFYGYESFSNIVLHLSVFGYAVYMLLSNQIILDKKKILWNFAWIIPIYIILIFTNQIGVIYAHRGNHFYTNLVLDNPFAFIYHWFDGALVEFDLNYISFTLNIWYYIFMLIFSAGIFFGVAWLIGIGQRYNNNDWLTTTTIV